MYVLKRIKLIFYLPVCNSKILLKDFLLTLVKFNLLFGKHPRKEGLAEFPVHEETRSGFINKIVFPVPFIVAGYEFVVHVFFLVKLWRRRDPAQNQFSQTSGKTFIVQNSPSWQLPGP